MANSIKIILQEKVVNLGNIGDVVTARGGFVRNYLLPRSKAILATAENMKEVDARRAEFERMAKEQLAQATLRAETLHGKSITIAAHAGDGGKLFGSVGPKEIAQVISECLGAVKKDEVRLANSIRAVGEYEIELMLHPDVRATVLCKVTSNVVD